MSGALNTEKLSKSYGLLQVLADVSLSVQGGSFTCIFGPSGCGKTTFLRILAGLEPFNGGAVEIDGQDVRALGTGLGRQLSIVWQDPRLVPWRTAGGNVELALELRGEADRRRRREVAREVLRLVDLESYYDRLPRELSGGMRQRVNLARALALDTPVILMDEPLSNLNEITEKRDLMEKILRLWELRRKTIVYITHLLNEALYLCDRLVLLSAKPTVVVETVDLTIPRPRDLTAEDLETIKRRVNMLYRDVLV
ncbi:MAG: ABC transporter ATP-binding protein [Deltaproteobacteria bacterium]|nr:ABC transporter ATP-binding protein [Deltaproteobacteria bacterium]